ncbi:MAG: hypothetical protein QM775_14770 [Pirellulales bacterium]
MLHHLAIGVVEAGLTLVLVTALQPRGTEAASPQRTMGIAAAFTLVGIMLSPWASPLPDGLDAALSALNLSEAAGVWTAPLADYAAPAGILNDGVAATLLIAALGTLCTFVITSAAARLAQR